MLVCELYPVYKAYYKGGEALRDDQCTWILVVAHAKGAPSRAAVFNWTSWVCAVATAAGGLSLPSCVVVVVSKFSSGAGCWKKDSKQFSRLEDAKRHENISTVILVGIILGVVIEKMCMSSHWQHRRCHWTAAYERGTLLLVKWFRLNKYEIRW